MDPYLSTVPSPAPVLPSTSTSTNNNIKTDKMVSTTLLAVVIPLVLVVCLLLVALLALYIRRRRASARAEGRRAWRKTLGAGRADRHEGMGTGHSQSEKPLNRSHSSAAHEKNQTSSATTPPTSGRRSSTVYSKALPPFPTENNTRRMSTHYSTPEAALHRNGSPPELDVFFAPHDTLGDKSSSLVSFPISGLDSPFHLPALASLGSLSAMSASTMSPPRRPGHPEPTFSPSSTSGAGSSPTVHLGRRGAMSTQPSTETFEAVTPSSSQPRVLLPTPPKRTLARSDSSPSPSSSHESPVYDIRRGGAASLHRWNSAHNFREVADAIIAGGEEQARMASRNTAHSLGPVAPLSPMGDITTATGPPSSFRASASQRNVSRDSLVFLPSGNNILSAAATAQLASLSFSLSQTQPAFLSHPPPSPTPSGRIKARVVPEPVETAEERRRRLATPRPDTGGDPCQVVKIFGLPREGENCLRGGFDSRPASRAGSIAGKAGELLGLGLVKKLGSRPSSRASSRSAVSSVGPDAAEEAKGGKRRSKVSNRKQTKKVADGPRPDTAGDPCGVQADIEWGRIIRGEAF